MTPDAKAADILTARLPLLDTSRMAYRHLDIPADTTYQLAVMVLDLARRVAELERLNAEQTGDGK